MTKFFFTLLFSFYMLSQVSSLWSESLIDRTYKQYLLINPLIQEIEVSIKNIGTPEQKAYFETTKKLFEKGFKSYLSSYAPVPSNMLSGYSKTFILFYKLQERIEKQLDVLSQKYIDDANIILIDIGDSLLELVIKYDSQSYLTRILIKRDIDPELESRKSYNTKEIHRITDKKYLMRVLKIGFINLEKAKIARIEAVNLESELLPEEKEAIFKSNLLYNRIEKFRNSIAFSKQAKINAFNAFKIYNQKLIYCAQKKYYNNPYFTENNIDPVFDPRLPSKYLAHANDVLNRDNQEEINIKIKQIYVESPTPSIECSYNYQEQALVNPEDTNLNAPDSSSINQ